MKAHTRILGVGSPFGDDRLAWVAVDSIRASAWYRSRAQGAVFAESFDRPGPALLAAMDGAAHAVLIDAIQSGEPPGTLQLVELEQLAWRADTFASGHTLGVAETLLLGKALELLPPRLTLIAVEVGRVGGGDSLSDEVRAALPALLKCVEACVTDEDRALGTPAAVPG